MDPKLDSSKNEPSKTHTSKKPTLKVNCKLVDEDTESSSISIEEYPIKL